MGYDLHITRAKDWTESLDHPISLEEWESHVARDHDMSLTGFAEADIGDGESIRYENEGLAVWTAYSGHGKEGNMAWFDFHDGRIVVKNPDEEIIGKMIAIAEALGARVQGDDGEVYSLRGFPEPEPPADRAQTARPWWKRLLGR
ncbi:MAG: hypothetical protein AB1646_09235 [Thermodesulfobacteriota bacterium]